jgi:hypothetical protein
MSPQRCGPESKATLLYVSNVGAEYFGIRFKVGTVMPHLPASSLVDEDVNLLTSKQILLAEWLYLAIS